MTEEDAARTRLTPQIIALYEQYVRLILDIGLRYVGSIPTGAFPNYADVVEW